MLGRLIVDPYEGLVEVLGVFAHGDSLAKPCNWTASSHSEGRLSELVWASRATGNETPSPKSRLSGPGSSSLSPGNKYKNEQLLAGQMLKKRTK